MCDSIKSRMVISTVLLIGATAGMLYAISKYQPVRRLNYEMEKPFEELVITEDYTISMLNKYEFDFVRCYRRDDYKRYELIPLSYADLEQRVEIITDNLRDGNNIYIYLLNPNEYEQVTHVYENGEIIWHLN